MSRDWGKFKLNDQFQLGACQIVFLSVPLLEPHINGTSLINVSDGCHTFNMFKSEIKTVLFLCYFNS